MTNLVISQMKDLLKIFYKSAQSIRQEMENNKKTFAPDYARELNVKLSEQLRSKAQRSKDLITEILSETLKKLSVLACPNASELDSADYHLLTDKNYIANALDFEIIVGIKQISLFYALLRICRKKRISVLRFICPRSEQRFIWSLHKAQSIWLKKSTLLPLSRQLKLIPLQTPILANSFMRSSARAKSLTLFLSMVNLSWKQVALTVTS